MTLSLYVNCSPFLKVQYLFCINDGVFAFNLVSSLIDTNIITKQFMSQNVADVAEV